MFRKKKKYLSVYEWEKYLGDMQLAVNNTYLPSPMPRYISGTTTRLYAGIKGQATPNSCEFDALCKKVDMIVDYLGIEKKTIPNKPGTTKFVKKKGKK